MAKEEMKAVLLHLGTNMWCGWLPNDMDVNVMSKEATGKTDARPATKMVVSDEAWRKMADYAVAKGANTILMDVGEALVYPSHPELAIEGSWSPDKMKAEVARLKAQGVTVLPKLNFSSAHDGWLKEYHHMVSTEKYYQVCEDLIRDAAEVFGHPQYLHLGYDEEGVGCQTGWQGQLLAIVRQGDLWWHDFLWFCRVTERAGMRPWIWSDYAWHHDDFYGRCPKSVVQSNWYYDEHACGFDMDTDDDYTKRCLKAYLEFEKAGFDQIPCGSNWNSGQRTKRKGLTTNDTFLQLVPFCRKYISEKHLLGFLMATWASHPDEKGLAKTYRGLDLLEQAMRK